MAASEVKACLKVEAATGCVLGGMIGDALGTCFEGMNWTEIQSFCNSKGWDGDLVRDYVPCIHMGQLGYVGPPKPEHHEQARFGMYSDDSDTALALAVSLVGNKGLDGPLVARQYAAFFHDDTCPRRFRPGTAMAVCKDIGDGVDYRVTGGPPNFPFPGGSFANGGAMRIWPLGIAFKSAPQRDFCRAVEEAIRSSHVHPEAIDGAVAVAYAVAFAAKHHTGEAAGSFDPLVLLDEMLHSSSDDENDPNAYLVKTPIFKLRIRALRDELARVAADSPCTEEDVKFLRRLLESDPRPGSSFEFQIASCDMIPCVLWIACRYQNNPEHAVMRAIAIGGDTDTTACMVGAIMGALHGVSWIPKQWFDGLENGTRGRDWAVGIAEQLSKLELTEPMTWGGE